MNSESAKVLRARSGCGGIPSHCPTLWHGGPRGGSSGTKPHPRGRWEAAFEGENPKKLGLGVRKRRQPPGN
eukprot:12918904-Prorocentrum_lima.AAC.1